MYITDDEAKRWKNAKKRRLLAFPIIILILIFVFLWWIMFLYGYFSGVEFLRNLGLYILIPTVIIWWIYMTYLEEKDKEDSEAFKKQLEKEEEDYKKRLKKKR